MSMIDDIRKDREAGTPGPWGYVDADTYAAGATDTYMTVGRDDYDPIALVVNEHPKEDCRKSDLEVAMNARRIARVPDMEAALLAADELAKAIEQDAWGNTETWAALVAYRKATETQNDPNIENAGRIW